MHCLERFGRGTLNNYYYYYYYLFRTRSTFKRYIQCCEYLDQTIRIEVRDTTIRELSKLPSRVVVVTRRY
jgi:hypothetical protein